MEKHKEKIKCPECGKRQFAEVLHTLPWWSYIHNCVSCRYTIMESEWMIVKKKKKVKEPLKAGIAVEPVLYAVLKLLTLVEVNDVKGLTHKVKITGAEGYIPVFKTLKEAEEATCNGKYKITLVSG